MDKSVVFSPPGHTVRNFSCFCEGINLSSEIPTLPRSYASALLAEIAEDERKIEMN